MSQELVNAVNVLTEETSELLSQYTGIKVNLEGRLAQATENAQAATAKAGEAANSAKLAGEKATLATQKATAATAEANKAKAAADRATEVSGLSTVNEAVQAALANAHQYAMTKAEFDARREANKAKYAGSGFVEWGKGSVHNDLVNINEGMLAWKGVDKGSSRATVLTLGTTNVNPIGVSRTSESIVNVDGCVLTLNNGSGAYCSTIYFPPAQNGTKTYDSATGVVFDYATQVDPKYGNVAPNTNEAVARAFEGLVKNSDFRLGAQHWYNESSAVSITSNGAVFSGNGDQRLYQNCTNEDADYDVEIVAENVGGVSQNVTIYIYGAGAFDREFTVKLQDGLNKFVMPKGTNNYGSDNRILVRAYDKQFSGTIKSVMMRPTSTTVITTRKDLVFLESWHEDISEKGVLFPLGNVQFGATSWNGDNQQLITHAGIEQGYSAFGSWDTTTEGRCTQLNNMSEAQKAKFISDPRNNIYYDPETKKLIQVRYRIRVVEGLGDDWDNFNSSKELKYQYISVRAQGKQVTNTPQWAYKYSFYAKPSNDVGVFNIRKDEEPNHGKCFALPIALVQRLNQGAYHPVYNPFGCAAFSWKNDNNGQVYWYGNLPLYKLPTSQKDCFVSADSGGSKTTSVNSGGISNASNMRPTNDPYKYYDAIYAGQVEDLRLSAHKQDTNKLLEDSIRKAVAGEMRGKSKVPFTKVATNLGTGGHSNQTDNWAVSGGNLFWVYAVNNVSVGDIVYLHDVSKDLLVKIKVTDAAGSRFNGPYETLQGSVAPQDTGEASTEVYVVYTEYLTPEFDNLPWTDIIGSPENIAATFPNGVMGQWIPVIPDGTGKDFPLNRKCVGTGSALWTGDNGANWTAEASTWQPKESVKNDFGQIQMNPPTGQVRLGFYKTLSNFTEKADNSKIVSQVGNVWVGDRSYKDDGVRLNESLIDKVCTSSNAPYSEYLAFWGYRIDPAIGDINQYPNGGKHSPITLLAPQNESPAVKTLSTLTEKDGLLYLQLHGNELKYKAPVPERINESATSLTKGKLYVVSDGRFMGNVIHWLVTTSAPLSHANWRIVDDKVMNHADDQNVYGVLFKNGWGDDSTIPVISGEGTKTDLNGNIVKTFCHHSLIPLCIASSSSSSNSRSGRYTKDHLNPLTKPTRLYNSLEEVPEPIRPFYIQNDVVLTHNVTYETVTDPITGDEYQDPIYTPVMGIEVEKLPAYYEDGGHIDSETVAKWTFHDDYCVWMMECADIKFYNQTPQYDDEGNEVPFDPRPYPTEPQLSDYLPVEV